MVLIYPRSELENLMGQIGLRLRGASYGFVLDHAVLPNKTIEVIVKLGSQKVEEKAKEEIQQLATTL